MRGWSPRAGALVRAARVQLHATGRDACARLGNPQEHRLTWKADGSTRLNRGRFGALTVCTLRYGAEVQIEPDKLQDFMLVQVPLRGAPASNAAASGWTPIRPVPRSSRPTGRCGCIGKPAANNCC